MTIMPPHFAHRIARATNSKVRSVCTFGLDQEEAGELMRLAEEESRDATSLYEFTHLIDKAFSPEQKKRVVELLWLVAFADGEKVESAC